jgi:hypothetical protein
MARLKIYLINFLLVLLAMEIKSFFDKGGSSNEIAYLLFRIFVLATICLLVCFSTGEHGSKFLEHFEEMITPKKPLTPKQNISNSVCFPRTSLFKREEVERTYVSKEI